jgi:uncharacterized membrane protein
METFRIVRLSRYILGSFFIIAGLNHFVMPNFYLPLIPSYLPYPEGINSAAGVAELLLGAMVIIGGDYWRSHAALGIFLLLVLFVPSHVYFIQMGSCLEEGLCVPPWIAWVRLLVIHPFLLFWAGFHYKKPRY